MKASKLKKDKIKSLRINSHALKIVENSYGSIQKFIDAMLDSFIEVEVKDCHLDAYRELTRVSEK